MSNDQGRYQKCEGCKQGKVDVKHRTAIGLSTCLECIQLAVRWAMARALEARSIEKEKEEIVRLKLELEAVQANAKAREKSAKEQKTKEEHEAFTAREKERAAK